MSFHRHGSFPQQVPLSAADPTAGLDQIAFPPTVSDGAVYEQNGVLTATVAHVYVFANGESNSEFAANGAYAVTVTDRATNQTTVPFTVTRDAVAPTVILTVAERIAASDIPLQWTAVETGSGIRGYDLEVSTDGGTSWTRLLTETQDTSYTFAGTLGVAYTFRVRATDNVSNVSAWVQAEARTVVVKKYYSIAGQRVAMRENNVVYWLHGDHLGSTSLTTNETGALVAEQKYLPYGEVRWVTGTLPTDLTFTGQRAENGLGLMDYRARFFSPRLGRFLSADTLVPGVGSQHLSRYMYVTGNPVKYNDPTGHARPTEESENYGKMPPSSPSVAEKVVKRLAEVAVRVAKYVPVSLTLRATKKQDLSGAHNFYPNFFQRNFIEFHTEVGTGVYVDTTLYPGRPIEWNISNGDVNFSTTSSLSEK